jgi:hypothetical protein
MDTFVRKANDAEAASGKDLVACKVIAGLLLMDAAIYFNDEAGGMTIEIRNKTIDHLLPPKMQSPTSVTPQSRLQNALCLRHFTTHCFRDTLILKPPSVL